MSLKNREQGFSYIDVMIAMVIMMVGILAMTGAVMANLVRSYDTDKQAIAKQIALSTVESIFAAKEIRKGGNSVTGWDSIGNVGSNKDDNGVAQGIFLTGFCPIRDEQGDDGIFGTADDACAAGSSCSNADGTKNTSNVVKNYTRQIVITDVKEGVNEAVRKRLVTVTVAYFGIGGKQRQETINTLVSLYQ